jgi:hypothetical protein
VSLDARLNLLTGLSELGATRERFEIREFGDRRDVPPLFFPRWERRTAGTRFAVFERRDPRTSTCMYQKLLRNQNVSGPDPQLYGL